MIEAPGVEHIGPLRSSTSRFAKEKYIWNINSARIDGADFIPAILTKGIKIRNQDFVIFAKYAFNILQ